MTEPSRELDCLDAQCRAVRALLEPLDERAWRRPTRCPPLDVHGLTAHLVAQLQQLATMRDAPDTNAPPSKDRYSWWKYDVAEDQRETLEAILAAERTLPPGPLAGAFRSAARDAVEACRLRLAAGDPVVAVGQHSIRLSDFLATRALEATIHGMDIADALGREFAPDPEAVVVTGDILRALLGADPRPAITDERLAILGTGRGEATADERAALGEKVHGFPLLA
jgi:uncharacterized protein (TIGR03083 family)